MSSLGGVFFSILYKIGGILHRKFISLLHLDSLFTYLIAALLRNKKLNVYDIKLGNHKVKMALNLSIPNQRTLYLSGMYEKNVTKLFYNLVNEGITVVDIGAYVGYYTVLASKLVGEKGRVLAFEPAPDSFLQLKKTIEANRFENVTLYQVAVSDKIGKTNLRLSSCPSTHAITDATDGFFIGNYKQTGETIEVEVMPLDKIIDENVLPYDSLIVKIDVEGAELKVLKGMEKILNECDNLHLIISVHEQKFPAFDYTPKQFFQYLEKHQLDLYLIGEDLTQIKSSPHFQQYEIYAKKRK